MLLGLSLAACAQAPPTVIRSAPQPSGQDTAIRLALENLPDGQALEWQDDDGSRGTIVIERTFRGDDGSFCRSFRNTVAAVPGPGSVTTPTACRQGRNSWHIL